MSGAQTYGWAVLAPINKGFANPGAPAPWSVANTRDGAMERFADQMRSWGEAADHHSIVWQRAYRQGWRLARVVITPTFGYGQ